MTNSTCGSTPGQRRGSRFDEARNRFRIRGRHRTQQVLERIVVIHAGFESGDMAHHRIHLEFVNTPARRIRTGQQLFAGPHRLDLSSPCCAVQQFGELVDADRASIVEGPCRNSVFENSRQCRIFGPCRD